MLESSIWMLLRSQASLHLCDVRAPDRGVAEALRSQADRKAR